MNVSYNIDDNGKLTVFVGNYCVADISGCGKLSSEEIDELIDEVLNDLSYTELSERSAECFTN